MAVAVAVELGKIWRGATIQKRLNRVSSRPNMTELPHSKQWTGTRVCQTGSDRATERSVVCLLSSSDTSTVSRVRSVMKPPCARKLAMMARWPEKSKLVRKPSKEESSAALEERMSAYLSYPLRSS
jgi:hypothetical protein